MDLATYKNIRVLLVDDDEDDFFIIKRTFAKIENSPFKLEWVSSYESAVKVIEKNQHDIYLIDYHLGAHTGLDLLEFAGPSKRTQPFILLTGAGNQSVEWKSLQLAASDYLVKGEFDANLLSRTLLYALQRKKVEEQRINQLIELNRSKDEFISIASHQLRTPATGVKQYVGMLIEGFAGTLTKQQEMLLHKAYDSNERQLEIVSDLLRVAQVDAGKVMLRKVPVELSDLVGDIVHEQQNIANIKHQIISYTPLKPDVTISIDMASIRMVIENLIDNASKYSHDKASIDVGVTDNERHAEIIISDDGVGIDPEGSTRLFEKFSRIDNPLSTKVGGSGLGLYWARKIVELHGGTLTHKPNKPKGTTFVVKLPKGAKL